MNAAPSQSPLLIVNHPNGITAKYFGDNILPLCRCISLAMLLAIPLPSFAGDEALSSVVITNPYSIISDRNAFRLNPPPAPAPPAQAPPPVLPPVILSGFAQTGNHLEVLLAVKVENPDAKGSPLNSYLSLAEGEKTKIASGENSITVELVKAYPEQEKVDIINSGTPLTLSLRENGFANPSPLPISAGARTIRPSPQTSVVATANTHPAKPTRNISGAPPRPPKKPAAGLPPLDSDPSKLSC